MLNKKILNFLLNVKHTVIDDVKIFDDDSIVFYVHPAKNSSTTGSNGISTAAYPLRGAPAEDTLPLRCHTRNTRKRHIQCTDRSSEQ